MAPHATHAPDDEAESAAARAVAPDRLTAFLDAAVAIALTLLALELPVPTGGTTRAMLGSVADHRTEYLAFALSFVVIAAHWRAHHEVFRLVRSLNNRLTSLTLAWLFMQVLMPFATRALTADGAFAPRFGLYAAVQVLASALLALSVREIRRARLYRADAPPREFTDILVRSVCLAAVFALSIPVAFLTAGTTAYLTWLAAPVTLAVAHRVRGRGQG